jgi:hypothetical protein
MVPVPFLIEEANVPELIFFPVGYRYPTGLKGYKRIDFKVLSRSSPFSSLIFPPRRREGGIHYSIGPRGCDTQSANPPTLCGTLQHPSEPLDSCATSRRPASRRPRFASECPLLSWHTSWTGTSFHCTGIPRYPWGI